MQLKIKTPIRATGRYKAVVHTGHEFDDLGNIIKYGDVLRETPFNGNVITYTGFSKILQNQGGSMVMVVGAGNTAPVIGNTTLVSYLGKSNSIVSQLSTRNSSPDINNEVWWRTTYRFTFIPGSLGGGSVNVAEAGISTNVAVGSVNSGSSLTSRGLLVDGGGSPTTVSVNNAVEYLDVIWEYTEWVVAAVTGIVSIDVDGVPTNFDYEIRPYYFDNVGGGFNYGGWQNAGNLTIPGFAANASKGGYPSSYATCVFGGSLVAITGDGLGSASINDIPFTMSVDAYVPNSLERTFYMTWLPTEGNIAGGIDVIRVNLGHSNWQVGFTPPIPKVNTKQLDMYWTYSMDNR